MISTWSFLQKKEQRTFLLLFGPSERLPSLHFVIRAFLCVTGPSSCTGESVSDGSSAAAAFLFHTESDNPALTPSTPADWP